MVDHVGGHLDAHVAHVEIGGELDDLENVATIFAGHASELDRFASLQSKTFGRGRSGHAADVDQVRIPGEVDGVRPLPGDLKDVGSAHASMPRSTTSLMAMTRMSLST